MSVNPKFLYMVQRLEGFHELLQENKLDGYVLTQLPDLFYFTDYWSEGYYGLIGLKESWLILPNLLFEQAKVNTYGFNCHQGPFFKTIKKILKKNRLKRIGFDPQQVPHALALNFLKMGFIPVGGLVAQLRAVKDPLELARLRKANHIAAEGAEFIRKRLKPGLTERRAAADLGRFFNIKGHGLAFDLIVAAGANGAFPHHITSDYKMKKGEAIICDIGATWEGYRSDLTRTFPLGNMSPSFRRVFKIVERAQKEGIERIRPGVTSGSIDQVSRKVIRRSGYAKYFCHSTGHGVGIDIHEEPRLGPGAKTKLKAGMVITVEPGIYLPGRFGVRIEDTLLVTRNGSELLTQ